MIKYFWGAALADTYGKQHVQVCVFTEQEVSVSGQKVSLSYHFLTVRDFRASSSDVLCVCVCVCRRPSEM